MKTTLPAVLFIIGLAGLSGLSTAKADDVKERFSAFCVTYDRAVVNEKSVTDIQREPDGYITMLTDDGRKVITGGVCTFDQIKPSKKVAMIEDKQLPKDGEPRRSIWH